MAVSTISNNGVLGGALITMLTMGIPGDSVTAILIGSLMMYGMTPGVKMFNEQPGFIVNIMLLMIFANIIISVLGILTAKASAKVLNVKAQSVWVAVAVLCVVGSYALNNSFYDVLLMFFAAILGFLFKKADFPPGPFILGLLLGNMLESNFRRALILSGGSLSIFYTRPVTAVLLLIIILTLLFPVLKRHFLKMRVKAA
ncbi:MAG: tripartite tricarboxylate transporter permease [Clostridium sp.]